MQTRFYIERRKDPSGNLILRDRPVFMSISFGGKRVMLGTGVKTDMSDWDAGRQRLKSAQPDSVIVNSWLDTLAETAEKTWETVRSVYEDPGADQFREAFLDSKPRYSRGLFEVFLTFMEEGSQRWSPATFRKVRTVYRHLKAFGEETGYALSFGSLNAEFAERFQSWYRARGNAATTTRKAVNIVVWFMNWATGEGYNTDLSYRKLYRSLDKKPAASRPVVYLRWEELMQLQKARFPERKMERVRDVFCFMSFTGVRFSELPGLKKEDVSHDELRVRSGSGKVRTVPLNRHAGRIVEAYEGKYYLGNTAFPVMSLITFNKYLREIGRRAGLDRTVDEGGDRLPLYRKLTAGTAVNTFIANALELEVSPEIISGFTGVRSDHRITRIRGELMRREAERLGSRP